MFDVAALQDELMMEILSWLPVKSLLTFRCVCKSWKSLISSSPVFLKLHFSRSARNPTLLLKWHQRVGSKHYPGIIPLSVRSLMENPTLAQNDWYSTDIDHHEYVILGSCNGLVCLLGSSHRSEFEGVYWFYLVNPATKVRSEKLATLHVDGFYRFAFGYDDVSCAYKVVAFSLDDEPLGVLICSLGDNCWRMHCNFPVVPFVSLDHEGYNYEGNNRATYYKCTLNWLALRNGDYIWNDTITISQLVIVSVYLGTEIWARFPLPGLTDEGPQSEPPTIGVLMDSFCFFHDYQRTHFVVWQMKDFGFEESWTQFMKFSYLGLRIDFWEFPPPFPLVPLCMSKDGDVLIMAIGAQSQAIIYHWRDNRVELAELPEYIAWQDTKYYVESLLSPCN